MGTSPLLTRETANTALTKVEYDNRKLITQLSGFKYRNMQDTITNTCNKLIAANKT